MKESELKALIGYRLRRAIETLEEALLMQRAAHWNACANRLYYAAFYAISALLLIDGHLSTKHSGVKALFNQHYIKPDILGKDIGRLYNRLFDLRQEGDYIDFVSLDAETVEPLIEKTRYLIEKTNDLIKSKKI